MSHPIKYMVDLFDKDEIRRRLALEAASFVSNNTDEDLVAIAKRIEAYLKGDEEK